MTFSKCHSEKYKVTIPLYITIKEMLEVKNDENKKGFYVYYYGDVGCCFDVFFCNT